MSYGFTTLDNDIGIISMDDTKLLDAVNAALATIPQDQRDQMKATAIANQPT